MNLNDYKSINFSLVVSLEKILLTFIIEFL
jgi:hypothetical protein